MTNKTSADVDKNADTHGRIRDGVDTARERVGSAYSAARDNASHALERSRDRARDTARQTADAIDSNPVGVLVGGLAVGALVAAVLPRSQREKELLAPVGRKVSAAAAAAIAAAKDAGREELDQLGITKGGARDQAKSLFEGLAKAAGNAGKAAAQAGREEVRGTKSA